MPPIGKRNFNYCRIWRSIAPQRSRSGVDAAKSTHMKNSILILAAIPGAFALAALMLFFRSPVGADTLVAYGSVFALLAVMAVEYRINWRRVFGRE